MKSRLRSAWRVRQGRKTRTNVLDFPSTFGYVPVMFFSGQREKCVPDVRDRVSGISAGGVCVSAGGEGMAGPPPPRLWRTTFAVRPACLRRGYGGLAGRSLGEGWKNVYFCFGEKSKWVKALCGIRVYFCLPAGKSRPSGIKDLAENMSTFVYFCLPFTSGRDRFCFLSTG